MIVNVAGAGAAMVVILVLIWAGASMADALTVGLLSWIVVLLGVRHES